MKKFFKRLSDRDKIRVICEIFGAPCDEPPDHRGHSLFIANRRFMFTHGGEIKGIIDYGDREPPEWVEE